MKIEEKGTPTTKFCGIRSGGLFEKDGRYYIKLDRVHTLQGGYEFDAVCLDDGGVCDISAYAKVRDLSECTLTVEKSKGGD